MEQALRLGTISFDAVRHLLLSKEWSAECRRS